MLDLFPTARPQDVASRMDAIAKKLGARVVVPLPDLDDTKKWVFPAPTTDSASPPQPKRITLKKNEVKRIQRQESIYTSLRLGFQKPLTASQLTYRLQAPNLEQMSADLQALFERGLVFREKVMTRNRKLVWAYWAVK